MTDLVTLVQREHVTDAYEGTVPEDRLLWLDALIARAARLLRSRLPGLPASVDSGAVHADDVRDVVVEAVLRVVRNPEGIYREQVPDYGYSKSVEVASGKLEFTADELARVTATVHRTAFEIVLG